MKKIGVFGSALGDHSVEEKQMAFELGKAIAKSGCQLVTGATFGLPNEAIRGARDAKGFTIGISPANSYEEHVDKYKLPNDDDVIVYTGLGYEGRNLVNIKTSDACIFIKGSIGTLNEFTIAVKEEKVIGVLENSGGVSAKLKEIVNSIDMNFKPKIIYGNDPVKLVDAIIGELDE